ncbi:hypothetical protein ACSBR2_017356 [Camellia fascicularis]
MVLELDTKSLKKQPVASNRNKEAVLLAQFIKVRFLGYCDEGEHQLWVYEYMSNGSLASLLFGVSRPDWNQGVPIGFGIARGLMYLHEECSTQIIHCNIKPQNILLDEYFTPRILDFGLAKLLLAEQT